jgi:hypothetical protein
VLAVEQGGRVLGQLDAANPRLDIPVGIPLAPGAPSLPIVGDLLANGQKVTQALQRLDLGVIRLGVAQLDQRGTAMTTPFAGFQLGATARMLDVQVLPTQALGLPNLPSALAQVALGEQVARAYAPTGGVVCRTSEQPVPPPTPKPQGRPPVELAYTTMAYKTIPMFWAGTAMLLVGVVLVAALPTLRSPRLLADGFSPGEPSGGAGAEQAEAMAATESTDVDDDAGVAADRVSDVGTVEGSAGARSSDAESAEAKSPQVEVEDAGRKSGTVEPADTDTASTEAESNAESAAAESAASEPESAGSAAADSELESAESALAESNESNSAESESAGIGSAEARSLEAEGAGTSESEVGSAAVGTADVDGESGGGERARKDT